MELQFFSKFISQTYADSGHTFTLDGETITASDLSDEHALLPLVLASILDAKGELSGKRDGYLSLLEPADPKTHLLGWRIKTLPDYPDGGLNLIANHTIRHRLAKPPAPAMELITDVVTEVAAGTVNELRPHLTELGFRAPFPRTTTPSPLDQ